MKQPDDEVNEAGMSHLERTLLMQMRWMGLPMPGHYGKNELVFAPPRKFRYDFAWEDHKLAAEVDGGTTKGRMSRHRSDAGFERDCEKSCYAALMGWRVVKFNTDMVLNGQAVLWLRLLLTGVPMEEEG